MKASVLTLSSAIIILLLTANQASAQSMMMRGSNNNMRGRGGGRDNDDQERSRSSRGGRGRREQMLTLRITNQAYQQPFSPFFIMVHNDKTEPLYVRGRQASEALASLAEDGTPEPLMEHYKQMEGVMSISSYNAITHPGETIELKVITTNDYPLVTIASMAVNTNDCFVSLNGASLEAGMVIDTAGLDAGSEVNNEVCSCIPGPACKDISEENMRCGGGEGFVHVHRGIQGIGQLVKSDTDWRNPMMRVVVVEGGDYKQ